MARVTISDYHQSSIPIPDIDLKAFLIGVSVKVVLGGALLFQGGDLAHLFWAGAVAGAATTFALPLSQMSFSSQLIDSPVEGGIVSSVGLTIVFPIYALFLWIGLSAAHTDADAAFFAGGMLPFQYVFLVLSSGVGGMVGGVVAVLVYRVYRKIRY